MHILFCAHLSNIFLFLSLLDLDILFIGNAKGVSGLFKSKTPAFFIPSYSNFVRYNYSQIEHVRPIFCAHLIIFLGVLTLKHYHIYTTFGELTLCNFQVNELTDCSKVVLLLWIIYVVSVLFWYAFKHVCLLMHCGHLLRKGWPLGFRLWCLIVTLSLSHWYPGSGVVLDCIDSWSLPSFLLCV